MDWILDNLQIVVAIAGAIAYWLNARSKDKAGEPADYDGDGTPDNVPGGGRLMREHEEAMEQAENTRRIQEEIRRKIAERQGGGAHPTPPMMPAPPVIVAPPPIPAFRREDPERALRERLAEARRVDAEREAAAVLERQRGLAEQLAALQSRKDATQREVGDTWVTEPVFAESGSRVRDDMSLVSELRTARSLRRAIILREVLGTPVGLR